MKPEMQIFDRNYNALKTLRHWAGHSNNQLLLGSRALGIRKKIRGAIMRAKKINISNAQNPTVGIFGPSQAGKSYLTAKFSESVNGNLLVNLDGPQNFLTEINPEGGTESTGLVTRFSANKSEKNTDFPIQAKLLTEVDLVCIFANSFAFDTSEQVYPVMEDIKKTLSSLNLKSNPQEEKYLEEFLDLENYLDSRVFDKPTRDTFNEVWEFLALHHNALDLTERLKIYELFWNKNSHLSALFIVLAQARHTLGDNAIISLPTVALLPREHSIIDVAILKKIQQPEVDEKIEVCNEAGQKVRVYKSVLSALIAELKLEIIDPQNKLFESADLLDFPGARTRFAMNLDSRKSSGGNSKTDGYFLRGKIEYLFQKYLQDLLIDALVLCIPPDPMNVSQLPGIVSDWISLNNKLDTVDLIKHNKFFFALTKFDEHIPDRAGSGVDDSTRFNNALEAALLQPFGGAENSWVHNWGGRPFSNVFPIRNPNYPLIGYFEYENKSSGKELSLKLEQTQRFKELSKGFGNSKRVQHHISSNAEKWDELIEPDNGGIKYLASSIERLDLFTLKKNNLKNQFSAMKREIVELTSGYVFNDDAAVALERHTQRFAVLWPEIEEIFNNSNFHKLLNLFMISEELALITMTKRPENIEILGPNSKARITGKFVPPILLGHIDSNDDLDENIMSKTQLTRPEFFTKAILEAWSNSVTQSVSRDEMSNLLGCGVEVIEFMYSHIAHQNQLKKLEKEILQNLKERDVGDKMMENSTTYAKIGCEIINAFVFNLGPNVENQDIEEVNDNSQFSKFAVPTINAEQEKWEQWMTSFSMLIADNSNSNSATHFDNEQNTILVECLSCLKEAEV
jgi:hypothetical protein